MVSFKLFVRVDFFALQMLILHASGLQIPTNGERDPDERARNIWLNYLNFFNYLNY